MRGKTLTRLAVLFVLVQLPGPLHAQDPEADSLLALANTGGASLFQEGRYDEAETLLERWLKDFEPIDW